PTTGATARGALRGLRSRGEWLTCRPHGAHMNLNRFTEKSQEALREAQSIPTRRNHQGVDVEHLLLGLLQQSDGLTPSILQAAGVNLGVLNDRLEAELGRIPQVTGAGGAPEQMYVTPRLNRLLCRAEGWARAA